MTIAEALRGLPWFAHVPGPALAAIAADAQVSTVADGEVLVREDEVVSHVIVVLTGCLAASCVDKFGSTRRLPDVTAGHLTGEPQEAARWIAPATLRARGETTVARIPAETMARFSGAAPAAALLLHEELRPHLERQRLVTAVHDSAAFAGVEGALLDEIGERLEPVSLYGGEVLFRQGDAGDTVYLVVSGRLSVLVTQADGEVSTVAELGAGEVVGEMAYLSASPRSATVVAVRDTQLGRLSRGALDTLVDRHPQAMLRLLSGRVVARVHAMSRGRRPNAPVVTVAVVPASRDVPIHEVATRLARVLTDSGATRHLTSDGVDAALGQPGAAQLPDRSGGRLVQWLAQLEADHRFVVYEAEARATPWTERCIRQADRILLVADAAGDATPGEIETHLLGPERTGRRRQTLVLLHPPGTQSPNDTARWLADRPPRRHLHVCLDQPEHVARLARFVTGRTVGLALGGGFARGLAHLGVFRALDEFGIAVDAVGGASMGAMVGAQWLSGWSPDRIMGDMSRGLADSFDDMTLPFLAFKRGGKYSRLVRGFFGEARIEDMWRPYFAVSANLNRAELAIHTRGRIADAVLASTRAPGIFPPLVMDGELHVDGGLINNVPVDVMRTFAGDGTVIGVDVSPPHELHTVHDYGEDVSGWSALWRRFTPARARRIYRPSILLVLMRVVEFGGISYRREKAGMADVYISPDVLRFKRNDFHAAENLADAGYQAARQALQTWVDGRGRSA